MCVACIANNETLVSNFLLIVDNLAHVYTFCTHKHGKQKVLCEICGTCKHKNVGCVWDYTLILMNIHVYLIYTSLLVVIVLFIVFYL